MRQQVFEAQRDDRWRRFAAQLATLEARGSAPVDDFPARYRAICQDLALARDRMFSQALIDRLNDLALRGHQQLYRARPPVIRRWRRYLLLDFPRAVRAELPLFALMSLLLYGSTLAVGGLVYSKPDLIYSFMDRATVDSFEEMYDPASSHFGEERGPAGDFGMFGYYIFNNISIAFRTFVGGLIFGIGALLSITYNGIIFGLVGGHLTEIGYTRTFWSFVVGHGSFELTAIVLSGVAGMRLGLALIAPGPRPRLSALRASALDALPLVSGAGAMLVIAAAIEAFWSSSAFISAETKYAVGAAFWVLVFAYLFAAGRDPSLAD